MFTPLSIHMDIVEAPWLDLDGKCKVARIDRIGGIPKATDQDKPGVAIAMQLEDGSWVVGQTTMRLFLAAAGALRVRYVGELGD